jgi:hypothetical protein
MARSGGKGHIGEDKVTELNLLIDELMARGRSAVPRQASLKNLLCGRALSRTVRGIGCQLP